MEDKDRIEFVEALLNVKIAALESVINAKSEAQKEAVIKAEAATEKRFESVNEFRGQLNDTIAQFATREALNSAVREQRSITDAHLATVTALDRRLSTIEGKMLVYVGVGSTLAIVLAGLFSWIGHSLHP
jgi:hypothetical protein